MRRRKWIRAKELRAVPTPAEAAAWELLRNRRCLGLKFRRQQVLYGLIADFYCAELKLDIELDGPIHLTREQRELDSARDAVLRGCGITVVRIPNHELSLEKLRAVITSHIGNHHPPCVSPAQ